jgi:hypothetical protein
MLTLEELHGPLMLLSFLSGIERAEVLSLACLRILLA